jgi:hypothetical protein
MAGEMPGDEADPDRGAARRRELALDPRLVLVARASKPRPPARLTAAARAPPETPPIGARRIG